MSLKQSFLRAIQEENTSAIQHFLKESFQKEDWNEILLEASLRGVKEVVQEAINKGADVNTKEMYGKTPLQAASFEEHIEIVSLLLAAGADANAKDNDGETPLDVAKTEEIKELLRNKMNSVVSKDHPQIVKEGKTYVLLSWESFSMSNIH